MGRFRIKIGEWELEYEGEDAAEKFSENVEWAKGFKSDKTPQVPAGEPSPLKKAHVKSRPPRIIPSIDETKLELPKTGKLGLLEFTEFEVRFPSEAIRNLNIGEATALLLCEVGRPLKKPDIDFLLNRGFRKVRPDVVKNVLTAKKYPSARKIIRDGEGYRLTAEGVVWVKDIVVPKLSAKPSSG